MGIFSLVDFVPKLLRRRKREALLQQAATWPLLTAKLLASSVVLKDIAAEGTDFQTSQVESPYFFTHEGNYYGGHARSIPLSDSEAHRLIPALPEDTPIQVRYNPTNPDQTATFPADNPNFPYTIWPM